ncbi:hypothetical protein CSC2_30130 [Clostridium zeae]|uniref:Uncharacterized protein n=1 Tax=Clostridium zeae TaxID=2759022 RepID=A0ABQ1ECI5_9CLOT|nr:hypothetical protein CSC2_30130 [Clostridium zeae]
MRNNYLVKFYLGLVYLLQSIHVNIIISINMLPLYSFDTPIKGIFIILLKLNGYAGDAI